MQVISMIFLSVGLSCANKNLCTSQTSDGTSTQDVTCCRYCAQNQAKSPEVLVFETNVTLADNESYGEKYVLDPRASKNPKDSLRYIPVVERQRLGLMVDFTQRVALVSCNTDSLSKEFIFDDPDLIIIAKIQEQLHNSVWFRVTQVNNQKGVYIIRGFNINGRMVYYKEWTDVLSHIIRSDKTKIVPTFIFRD